jgi:hypothetical protein
VIEMTLALAEIAALLIFHSNYVYGIIPMVIIACVSLMTLIGIIKQSAGWLIPHLIVQVFTFQLSLINIIILLHFQCLQIFATIIVIIIVVALWVGVLNFINETDLQYQQHGKFEKWKVFITNTYAVNIWVLAVIAIIVCVLVLLLYCWWFTVLLHCYQYLKASVEQPMIVHSYNVCKTYMPT